VTEAVAPPETGKRFRFGPASEVPAGGRVVRTVGGRSVGVFNVGGRFYALHNRCPHRGGALCLGPVTGTALPTDDYRYEYGHDGELVRCAWHGWEFEIASGRCLVDARMRARTFAIEQEGDDLYVVM
jgi:nitrite reductase/ring-hydroxylating ferredoxin subunit